VIDFNGVTEPLTSLCVYPVCLFQSLTSRFFDQETFRQIFTTRESSNPLSMLGSKEVRQRLMERAKNQTLLDHGILWPYALVRLRLLIRSVYGTDNPRELEDEDAELKQPRSAAWHLLSCGCVLN
jgi:hypothetical protein